VHQELECTKIVESCNVIVMIMGIEHSIERLHIICEHLLAEISACIDYDVSSIGLDQHAHTETFITRIIRAACLAIASDHRNSGGGASTEEREAYQGMDRYCYSGIRFAHRLRKFVFDCLAHVRFDE
jgi:hypothetical protein